MNDPTNRRNSTASVSTTASDPRSRASSFASTAQENLIQNRLNHPLNVASQEEQRRANEEARNIAAHETRIKQWARNNRVATMKRQGRGTNSATLMGLPHRSNMPPTPVANVAKNWSAVEPIPIIRKKKPGTRRNNRTRKNRRN